MKCTIEIARKSCLRFASNSDHTPHEWLLLRLLFFLFICTIWASSCEHAMSAYETLKECVIAKNMVTNGLYSNTYNTFYRRFHVRSCSNSRFVGKIFVSHKVDTVGHFTGCRFNALLKSFLLEIWNLFFLFASLCASRSDVSFESSDFDWGRLEERWESSLNLSPAAASSAQLRWSSRFLPKEDKFVAANQGKCNRVT